MDQSLYANPQEFWGEYYYEPIEEPGIKGMPPPTKKVYKQQTPVKIQNLPYRPSKEEIAYRKKYGDAAWEKLQEQRRRQNGIYRYSKEEIDYMKNHNQKDFDEWNLKRRMQNL